MKFVQPPLKINCEGLSKKLIFELADRLSLHFVNVEIWGDEIFASKTLSHYHYDTAWRIIDEFGVTAA
ncbi:MAG: hypothetical protein IKN27_08835 [Selenomonadaceae bacterium]|nr:hypothetical protein [Selenomonadaceae bacterium]